MSETVSQQSRIALITGGSRGIGFGIARALAAAGWRLAINGRRAEQEVADVLDELRRYGTECIYCQADVGDSRDRQMLIHRTRDQYGQLHLLVNNAGITSPGRRDILEATEEDFDRVMAVNLKGAFFLTQAAANWMIGQSQANPQFRGCVVNISSISAEMASTNRGDYCISWGGLAMATKLWAARLAAADIDVYEIRPGIIRTDMTAAVTEKYDRLIDEGLTLNRRWGTPEDVGRAVAALASGDLTYATGNVLYIDGGLHVRRL